MLVRVVFGAIGWYGLFGWAAADGRHPVLVPWTQGQASVRQVIELTCPVERIRPVVQLALRGPGDLPFRVETPEQPGTALPVFQEGSERILVQLPGRLDRKEPRRLVVYWSAASDWRASPAMADRPIDGDDYATVVHGDAWDFDEGDQEGIRTWGNRPTEYGEVRVERGVLVVPVTGKDPYFIWGVMFGKPRSEHVEHIDSGVYRFLQLRVRQSRKRAQWSVYVTDVKGQYQGHHFWVSGTQWQVLELDLTHVFPRFWDGREMRALRIDCTNDAPGTTVEIDWVRLLRPAPTAVYGPTMTQAQVKARSMVREVRAQLASKAQAGDRPLVRVAALGPKGRPVSGAPLVVALEDGGQVVARRLLVTDEQGLARARFPVGTKAGGRRWVVGIADDLGWPGSPVASRWLKVEPGPLYGYRLVAERELVPVSQRRTVVKVWGVDRFGNTMPVSVDRPRWRVTGGAKVSPTPLSGAPAQVTVICADQPLVRHRIVLEDGFGHRGEVELMTMAHKKASVQLSATGYLVGPGGDLYLPLGGFYANWPSSPPAADGGIGRALDLFPCGPKPYPHGFPWSEDVEQKVAGFLRLCKRHGVTGLRLMLRNMDLVGRADPVQLRAVLRLLDMARPMGIRFDVVLFEDFNKPPYVNRAVLEKVVLPRYTDAELDQLPAHRARFLVEKRLLDSAALKYTDPDAIACQKDYLRDLLPYLAGREEIFCYELENEMVRPPMSWVNEMTRYIRSIDPRTLVLGNPGPHYWPEPLRWRSSEVDLFSYHPYNDGQPDADHGAVVFMRSKWAAAAGKAMFTGEGGINQHRWQRHVKKVPPDYAARGVRDQIWLSMCCGACGAFMWTPGHELEMAEFGKVTRALRAVGVELKKIKRRRPSVAVVMAEDDTANRQAYSIAWKLLGLGVDFDTVLPSEASRYALRIPAAQTDGESLNIAPELFKPGNGYQLAYLVADDLSQALVYLRNVAGGIADMGDGRPCYVRRPAAATARLGLLGGNSWAHVSAYDLDEDRPAPVGWARVKNVLILGQTSSHDYVIGLRR